MLEESHRLHRELGDPVQSALDVLRFAALIATQGRAESAARVMSSSDALAKEIGYDLRGWDPEFFEATLTTIRDQLDEATFAEAWEEGRTLTADEAVALALSPEA